MSASAYTIGSQIGVKNPKHCGNCGGTSFSNQRFPGSSVWHNHCTFCNTWGTLVSHRAYKKNPSKYMNKVQEIRLQRAQQAFEEQETEKVLVRSW